MLVLKKELQDAALEIRQADALLTSIVADLQARGVWTGNDADAFQREWRDQVHAPLAAAAGIIDRIEYITL